MKQLLYVPVNNYFFRGKANTTTLKRCLNQYGGHFSTVTSMQDTHHDVLTKPMLISKKQENICIGKKFSSYSPKKLMLMDFDVWVCPKFFRAFRSLYYFYFVLKELDGSISVAEFSRSTITALQVVTTLLSELRFTELEGLLTQECIKEVEKNLKLWPKHQISLLAINSEKIMKTFPCDVIVFSDENNGKLFVEIRVIHLVLMKYTSSFDKYKETLLNREASSEAFPQNNPYMFRVFNSKFIREFTEGVTDQWTINAINVKCFSNLVN